MQQLYAINTYYATVVDFFARKDSERLKEEDCKDNETEGRGK